MIEEINRIIIQYNLGDWSGILGILITIVGFVFTLIGLRRAKEASKQVSEAVDKVRQDAAKMQAVGSMSAIITSIEEVKRLHRTGDWNLLSDRYSTLRKNLINIKESTIGLSDDQLQVLQGAIYQFSGIERKVERALGEGVVPENVPALNNLVSNQADKLQGLLAQIQSLASTK